MFNVENSDPPDDTGGVAISHYLVQMDSGMGKNLNVA
jgi:hypothetical protein